MAANAQTGPHRVALYARISDHDGLRTPLQRRVRLPLRAATWPFAWLLRGSPPRSRRRGDENAPWPCYLMVAAPASTILEPNNEVTVGASLAPDPLVTRVARLPTGRTDHGRWLVLACTGRGTTAQPATEVRHAVLRGVPRSGLAGRVACWAV